MRVVDRLFECRRQCVERRAYLVELDLLAQRLGADATRLLAEIERIVAAGDSILAAPLLERLGKLQASVTTVNGQIAAAKDALAAAEQELQRHELAATRLPGDTGISERRRTRRSPDMRPAATPIVEPDRGS